MIFLMTLLVLLTGMILATGNTRIDTIQHGENPMLGKQTALYESTTTDLTWYV